MESELTIYQPPTTPATVAQAGQVANVVAARHSFDDYRSRKAANTIRRQDTDLALFASYLAEAGITTGDLATDPNAWQGITWGLVEGFVKWQLQAGYSVGSVNVRLSTVKTYARLATKAGVIDPRELALIRTVGGYSRQEARRIDEWRGMRRVGAKKAKPVSLTPSQVVQLKDRPNTPQGRRDRLIMCLLLDHGLRVGEVAGLSVEDFDLEAGELRFYRPKVDKVQTHRLTPNTLEAARSYLTQDDPSTGPLLRGSRKGGNLTAPGMSVRALTARVKALGERIGVDGLSAHDCRHYWATQAARSGTPIDRLQDAGGWNSPAMPLRYVEAAQIANEGVSLDINPEIG